LKKKREEKIEQKRTGKKEKKKNPTTVARWVWVVLCWQRAKKKPFLRRRETDGGEVGKK
jgi:hypothetical protein